MRGVAREGNARLEVALPSSLLTTTSEKEDSVAKVVIGVDPHKRSNAVVVINAKGTVLARRQFDNTAEGFRELKGFWRQWRPRTWAVEGCNGVGKYLAQRLVAEGETVLRRIDPAGGTGASLRRRQRPQDRRYRRPLDRPWWASTAPTCPRSDRTR